MASTAGTVVAAGLESAGYVAQSQVLVQLEPLIMTLAVLISICVVAKALWSLIVDGAIQSALWSLIGPALVLGILYSRVNSLGVEWQYGQAEDQRRSVILQQDSMPQVGVSVSWFFDKYNSFISYVVRNLTDIFTNDQMRDEILFTNRQRIMQLIEGSSIVSPGLLALVNEGLQGKCGVWLAAARDISRGNRDPEFQGTPEYNQALMSYNALYTTRTLQLDGGSVAYQYLENLLPSMTNFQLLNDDGDVIGVGPAVFVNKYCDTGDATPDDLANTDPGQLNGPVSCEQIWCWTAMGLYSEANSTLSTSIDLTVGQNATYAQATDDQKKAIMQEILKDLSIKVSPSDDPNSYNEEDASIVPVVIGGMLLSQALGTSPTSIRTDFAEGSGVQVNGYAPDTTMSDSDMQALRESSNDYQSALAGRTEVLSGAMTMPYFQGILLFCLALLFPFFTLLLLIPGRSSGFLLWCGAWAWVKLWDVGWAAVMLLDQVLWDLMPHQAVYSPTSGTAQNTPITVLESAFQGDATYSLVMYYTIVAVLIFAVPSLLGQLLMRSMTDAADVLSERLQWINSGFVADVARDSAFMPTYSQIGDYQEQYYDRAMKGLPNEGDLSQSRSSVVYTNFGLDTGPTFLMNTTPQYQISPPPPASPPQQQPAVLPPPTNRSRRSLAFQPAPGQYNSLTLGQNVVPQQKQPAAAPAEKAPPKLSRWRVISSDEEQKGTNG